MVGTGDEHGFEFGINKSRLTDSDLSDDELDNAQNALDAGSDEEEDDSDETDSTEEPESLFSCGPSDGVEIWEWFDAVTCWIEEEISKLDEMVTVDNSCSGTISEPEEDDPDLAASNMLVDSELAVNNPDSIPATIDVSIPKKTLVVGEETTATISVFNSKGKLIIGYLIDPLKIKANNVDLDFDQDEKEIFTGVGKIKITAVEESAGAIEASLGSISETVSMRVAQGINVLLSHERDTESNRPAYKISATLIDNNGNQIDDVNTAIRLNTLSPMDGLFVSNLLRLNDGVGETLFFPNPTATHIEISSTHPVYSGNPITVPPIVDEPFKIVIKEPKRLQIQKTTSIPVIITDGNGILTNGFNEPIQVKVSEKFKKYAEVVSETINIQNGRGTIQVNVKGETGQVNLIAEHEDLRPGIASIPITVRMDEEEWSQMFTQNLFASFVGFPAANFLEENYFGGMHLFNGKTQAVFGFVESATPPPLLSIQPNYYTQTTSPQQVVKVQSLGDKISLQVMNNQSLESLLSTIVPLDFNDVALWDGESAMEEGMIYIEPTNKNKYTFEIENESIHIKDLNGDLVFVAGKDHLHFHQLDYEFFHESEGFVKALELVIANAEGEVGRLYLNFKPRHLNASNFSIGKNGALKRIFAGKSTADPTGLVLFDPNGEVDEKLIPKESFGFEKDSKYILRFAGGSPVGEAVQYNLPYNAVLLGDPTIRLKNNSVSSLNYDNTIGRQIFQDAEATDVIAMTNFDFNKDNIQDAAIVMKDGRVRLFEGGETEPLYRDRGNIAYLADGTLDIIAFDFKQDGYEDLLVSTREGRLAILHNDGEVITRTDQKIKVGKQLYQIQKADMDADGYPDLITLDSRGDIRIFYNQSLQFTERPVSTKKQIPENGMLIGNYGFSLKKGQNLQKDLKARYLGMSEPEG
ncbi:VCBS repeat-containing protein, partial [Candidatus Pacearchaeota archaeon]|nr:VCBS repeat-containing protein [Candidatus Pacearchaeota archaeon]